MSAEPENTRVHMWCTIDGPHEAHNPTHPDKPGHEGICDGRPFAAAAPPFTVELLTRAADAAGKAGVAADLFGPTRSWTEFLKQLRSYMPLGRRDTQILAASGPDHWRAVETLIRQMLKLHDQTADRWCLNPVLNRPYGQPVEPCPALEALRPLAEQVLQHLGDTA